VEHFAEPRSTGTRLTVSAAGSEDQAFLGLNIMSVQSSSQSFALCVEDGGMEDLEARKLYQILPDRSSPTVKLRVRDTFGVVDESGEDYIYPADVFVPGRLPAAVVQRLRGPVRSRSAAAGDTIRRVR
jgi:hypothetical protein